MISIHVALALYALAFWWLFARLIIQRQVPHRGLILSLLVGGLGLHALVLRPLLFTPHGVDFNLFNILSLTSWLMLTFSVAFSSYRPILGLNLLAIPIAATGLFAGVLWRAPYQPISHLGDGLEWHIMLSLAAYCMLFMAAIQALLLHAQNRELKHKTSKRIWVSILPPLQTMESLLFDMLGLGFVLLTIALILGAYAVNNLITQHLAHKTFFSLLSWLVFGVLLYGRWRMGWRGQRAVTFTLWGFFLLLVGFIGSKFVLEMILHLD